MKLTKTQFLTLERIEASGGLSGEEILVSTSPKTLSILRKAGYIVGSGRSFGSPYKELRWAVTASGRAALTAKQTDGREVE